MYVDWSYAAQKCIIFHPQPSRFRLKNFPGRNPDLCLQGRELEGGEEIKGFLPLKEGRKEGGKGQGRDEMVGGRGGPAAGGIGGRSWRRER